jgi:hypothetical protein
MILRFLDADCLRLLESKGAIGYAMSFCGGELWGFRAVFECWFLGMLVYLMLMVYLDRELSAFVI